MWIWFTQCSLHVIRVHPHKQSGSLTGTGWKTHGMTKEVVQSACHQLQQEETRRKKACGTLLLQYRHIGLQALTDAGAGTSCASCASRIATSSQLAACAQHPGFESNSVQIYA